MTTSTSSTRDWVWLLPKGSEDRNDLFAGRVVEREPLEVELEDGTRMPVDREAHSLIQMDPRVQTGVDDMATLPNLHLAALRHNLWTRYHNDVIYTYTGPILVAINPYKVLPIYTPEIIRSYHDVKPGERPPHIFAVSSIAYQGMLDGQNQSIIISGESGAGKTESTKLILQYLAAVSSQHSWVEQQIMEASTILEAFGNAKTLRNDNSSRFGKWTTVQFDFEGRISGANIEQYLLEKSRITFQNEGERNYHIFYQMCKGCTEEERAEWHLGSTDEYRYLAASGAADVASINDVKDHERVRAAMSILNISDEDQQNVYRVLAAVLHIGQLDIVTSEEENSDDAVIANQDVVDIVATLLAVDRDELAYAITTRTNYINNEKFIVPLNTREAEENRDAMAKAIYGSLFIWLVSEINRSISRDEYSSFIGVLDIFGFENYDVNSFEQFCINYANEKLQADFNRHIFKLEQAEYESEQINWSDVKYVDNLECLNLIEKRPVGVVHILAEHCKQTAATDETFIQHLHNTHTDHAYYEVPLLDQTSFTIRHYPGDVTYASADFLKKNRDAIVEEIKTALRHSDHRLVSRLFREPGDEFDSDFEDEDFDLDTDAAAAGSTSQRDDKRGAKLQTVASFFSDSLNSLISIIGQTNPYFVRCVKPNELKISDHFDGDLVVRQLLYSGLLETLRIRRLGYPVRFKHADFVGRYKSLLLDPDALAAGRVVLRPRAEELLDAAKDELQAAAAAAAADKGYGGPSGAALKRRRGSVRMNAHGLSSLGALPSPKARPKRGHAPARSSPLAGSGSSGSGGPPPKTARPSKPKSKKMAKPKAKRKRPGKPPPRPKRAGPPGPSGPGGPSGKKPPSKPRPAPRKKRPSKPPARPKPSARRPDMAATLPPPPIDDDFLPPPPDFGGDVGLPPPPVMDDLDFAELPPPPFLDALPPPPIDELAPAASQRTVDAVDEGFTPELDRSPLMVLCQYLCQVAGLPTDTWQIGRTKVYLREDNLNYLDAQRTAALTKVSTKIQAQYRAHSVSSRYNALRASAFKIGPIVKGFLARMTYMEQRYAAITIQFAWLEYQYKKSLAAQAAANAELEPSAIKIQAAYRGHMARKRYAIMRLTAEQETNVNDDLLDEANDAIAALLDMDDFEFDFGGDDSDDDDLFGDLGGGGPGAGLEDDITALLTGAGDATSFMNEQAGAFDDVFLELDGFIGDLVDNDLNEDIDVEALEAKRLRELEELRGLDADEMEHMADLEALLGAPAVDEEMMELELLELEAANILGAEEAEDDPEGDLENCRKALAYLQAFSEHDLVAVFTKLGVVMEEVLAVCMEHKNIDLPSKPADWTIGGGSTAGAATTATAPPPVADTTSTADAEVAGADAPSKPGKPGKPSKPGKPGKPGKPKRPSDKPSKPNKPGKPTKPGKPAKPSPVDAGLPPPPADLGALPPPADIGGLPPPPADVGALPPPPADIGALPPPPADIGGLPPPPPDAAPPPADAQRAQRRRAKPRRKKRRRMRVMEGNVAVSLPDTLAGNLGPFERLSFERYAKMMFKTHYVRKVRRRKLEAKEMIVFTKTPITESMHKLEGAEAQEAVNLFPHIMGYMGDLTPDMTPHEYVLYIIESGIRVPALRDEIYVQVLRQIRSHKVSKHAVKGWELLCLCLGVFAPTNQLLGVLLNYLEKCASGSGARAAFATFALDRMARILMTGLREEAPSFTETAAVCKMVNLQIPVVVSAAAPEVRVSLPLTSTTLGFEAVRALAEQMGIDGDGFGLYCETRSRMVAVGEYDFVCDTLRRNEATTMTWHFRRKAFFDQADLTSADGQMRDLLFSQLASQIGCGKVLVAHADLARHGAHVSAVVHGGSMGPDSVEGVIPGVATGTPDADAWAAAINAAVGELGLAGVTADEVKDRYLEWVSTQPFFGYTIFNVTLSGDVEGVPDDAVLAVSRHGVAFVSTSALEVAKQWSYRQVGVCAASEEAFTLEIFDSESGGGIHAIPMATDDGRDILRLTRIYANHAVSGEDTNFGVVITPTTPWAPVMLHASRGDVVTLIEYSDDRQLFQAKISDTEKGWIPCNYVRVVSPSQLQTFEAAANAVAEVEEHIDWDQFPWPDWVARSFAKSDELGPNELAELAVFAPKPVKEPLLAIPDKFKKFAMVALYYVMRYMGDLQVKKKKKDSGPHGLLKDLIGRCVSIRALRDEVYTQIVKQVTDNPGNESRDKGWVLLAACCGVFAPSPDLELYLRAYIEAHLDDPLVGPRATVAKRRLLATLVNAERKKAPSDREIEAILSGAPVILRVSFMDGATKSTIVECQTSARDATRDLAERISLRDASLFSLYVINAEGVAIGMDDQDRVMDAIATHESGGEVSFLMKRKLFVTNAPRTADPVETHLLYHQAVDTVHRGIWPVSSDIAAKLFAIQARIENASEASFDELLAQKIPANVYSQQSPEEWRVAAHRAWQLMPAGLSPIQYQHAYMDILKTLPLYGAALYPVTNKAEKGLPGDMVLAVDFDGLHYLDVRTREPLAEHNYEDLAGFCPGEDVFCITIGNLVPMQRFVVNTNEGFAISSLVSAYHTLKGLPQ